MMKKLTAILLSFLMIFQLLPTVVVADMLQEDGKEVQSTDSNIIEGVDVEEVFETIKTQKIVEGNKSSDKEGGKD